MATPAYMKKGDVLQFICEILDSNGNLDKLIFKLKSNQCDYESLVKYGSAHLVIPAIYCSLKSKKVLKYIPEDLKLYLEEISNLNLQRNKSLIKDITFLSDLLKANDINHVFLKGAALLSSGYYNAIEERMVGDIDILVDENQLDTAIKLLKNNGYHNNTHSDFEYEHLDHRHLPRFLSHERIGAVEIHRRLLHNGENKLFNSIDFLEEKRLVNGVFIGSPNHLILHNIYGQQINNRDFFYNIFNIKSGYDHHILLNNFEKKALPSNDKLLKDFLNKYNLYFKNGSKQKNNFRLYLYKLKNNNNRLSYLNYKILRTLNLMSFYVFSAYQFTLNAEFRKAVLKKKGLI